MSWALRSRSRRLLQSFSGSRGAGGGIAMWDLCALNWRLAEFGGGRCLLSVKGGLFLRDFLPQGLGSSRLYGIIAAAPPGELKQNWTRKDWKKRRPGAVQAVRVVEGKQKHSVVVVESPTKAKTITKYLGAGFTVLPSYGHVRDLAARAGSVRPDEDFTMLWEVPATARPHINSIKAALKGAEVLVLASDPDREGEAIAWHVLEMLAVEGALKKEMIVKRVVFNEITKMAVMRAMESARDVSGTLVDAYLARRALDYLIGFNLSPVLWRKLPGSKSAGRVQSAALRLICDREKEIEAFNTREYWTVEVQLGKDTGNKSPRLGALFHARLTHLWGEKLGQFSIANTLDAEAATKDVSEATLCVGSVKKRIVCRSPPAPYITSTLQQDASAKLGFGVTRTMSVAQHLYEGVKLKNEEQTGLITYMRTDGVQISSEAVESIRSLAVTRYGKEYVPAERQLFVSKVKNAQEAHEAIRPTDIFRLPSSLVNLLEEDALQLYTLIWVRTMACQLERAVSNQVSVEVIDDHDKVQLRASSSSVSFPGFLDVFKDTAALGAMAEKFREINTDEQDTDLQQLKAGDLLILSEAISIQHHTEPPPRFSEGTLVKRLEELGIGRPSTYAPTLRTLQLRNYVRVEKRRIFPETRGRMVSAFLAHYFPEFADYDFTANMESQLDEVSAGQANWKTVLADFWPAFHETVLGAMKVPVDKVVEMLEEVFAKQFFPSTSSGVEDRACPSCKEGRVCLKLSRFGAGYFFGCSRYPDCLFKANMISGGEEELSDEEEDSAPSQWSLLARPPKPLGVDPVSQLQVVVRVGPYGAYVQLGEASKQQTPRRTTLPKGVKAEEVTLEKALELLSYPRELGKHPEEGTPIMISIGKFGFFLRHRAIIASVPQGVAVEDMSMDKAVEILKGRNVSRRGRKPHKAAAAAAQDGTVLHSSGNNMAPSMVESTMPDSKLSTELQEQKVDKQQPVEKQKRRKNKKTARSFDVSTLLKTPLTEADPITSDSNVQEEIKSAPSPVEESTSSLEPIQKKRGRGRPRKNPVLSDSHLLLAQSDVQ